MLRGATRSQVPTWAHAMASHACACCSDLLVRKLASQPHLTRAGVWRPYSVVIKVRRRQSHVRMVQYADTRVWTVDSCRLQGRTTRIAEQRLTHLGSHQWLLSRGLLKSLGCAGRSRPQAMLQTVGRFGSGPVRSASSSPRSPGAIACLLGSVTSPRQRPSPADRLYGINQSRRSSRSGQRIDLMC